MRCGAMIIDSIIVYSTIFYGKRRRMGKVARTRDGNC
jgi:hypothetical protein